MQPLEPLEVPVVVAQQVSRWPFFLAGLLVGALAVGVPLGILFYNQGTELLSLKMEAQHQDDKLTGRLAQFEEKTGAKLPDEVANQTQHAWLERRLEADLALAAYRMVNTKQSLESCQSLVLEQQQQGLKSWGASVQQQTNQMVAAGGLNSPKGKQELAVLLDLIRPGLGRLVVQQ